MTQVNEELVGTGYAAFSSGDVAALTDMFSPDAVWHVPGDNLLAGVYEGRDAVLGSFGRLGAPARRASGPQPGPGEDRAEREEPGPPC